MPCHPWVPLVPDFSLRPAQKSDAADLAILDNIAGHGISYWFWQESVINGEGVDPMEIGRKRFSDETSVFGWKNATVAVHDEIILGSVTSYVMVPLEEDEQQFKRDTSAFQPIFELFDLVHGDWFIDSLAVFSHARGKLIASALIDNSLAKAKVSTSKQASLVVEDSNEAALKIYHKRGFTIREKRPFIEFDGPAETKEWLLMTAQV